MKDVPLHAENFVTGTPATGYELTAVELAEDSVPVAARQEILDAISELTTVPRSISTVRRRTRAGYVRLKKLTGIENTLPTEIGVTARISEKRLSARCAVCRFRRMGWTTA